MNLKKALERVYELAKAGVVAYEQEYQRFDNGYSQQQKEEDINCLAKIYKFMELMK